MATKKSTTWQERFWSYVNKRGPDVCWWWTGALSNRRGVLAINRKPQYAPRLSLELFLGRELVAGEQALHSCDNPECVNPRHLRVGTHADNMADIRKHRKILSMI